MNVRDSMTARLVTDAGDRLRAAASTATAVDLFRETQDDVGETASAAFRASAFGRATAWFGRTTRESWLYRWLTTEPDPDVVVIDLRETWTVGPMLAILDRLLVPLIRYGRTARTRTTGVRIAETITDRPVQVASIVVLVAVVANLALMVALGTFSSSAVGIRLLLSSVALAGTRVTASVDELADTRAFELLVALLEPPEPPDGEDERRS